MSRIQKTYIEDNIENFKTGKISIVVTINFLTVVLTKKFALVSKSRLQVLKVGFAHVNIGIKGFS